MDNSESLAVKTLFCKTFRKQRSYFFKLIYAISTKIDLFIDIINLQKNK